MGKIYINRNVIDSTQERISMLFDNFENITVSVSSGKDSTVLLSLALKEAQKRQRKITAFFIDQEAEYHNSIEIIKEIMSGDNIIPNWYQVPLYMTNSTSYSDYFLYAWGPGEKWMREKDALAIHEIEGDKYPDRFYGFIEWYQKKNKDHAFLVGLRADESITRYRAVTKYAGWNGIKWGTSRNDINTFYPIYDWTVYDIWKYIYDNRLKYNKIYDLMFMDGYSIYKKMRISNLIHEKSYHCLVDLPKFEPETYNKLCKRISGISTASRYATEKLVFSNKVLPEHYKTWKEFRDFLLINIQNQDHRNKFTNRFDKQEKNENIYKKQVGQLLINDYENSRAYDTKATDKIMRMREKWMQLL